MKCLYEITNGYTGESYVRCYAWTDSEARARELGIKVFGTRCRLQVRLLFGSDADEFVTPSSDSGYDYATGEPTPTGGI